MRRGPGPGAATQDERIARLALAGHTIHQDDFWPGPAPDGGPGMRAVRSRISSLEGQGWGFHHYRRPDGTIEYHLAHVPERPVAPAPVESDGDVDQGAEQLALELPRPRPGLYDIDEAA